MSVVAVCQLLLLLLCPLLVLLLCVICGAVSYSAGTCPFCPTAVSPADRRICLWLLAHPAVQMTAAAQITYSFTIAALYVGQLVLLLQQQEDILETADMDLEVF